MDKILIISYKIVKNNQTYLIRQEKVASVLQRNLISYFYNLLSKKTKRGKILEIFNGTLLWGTAKIKIKKNRK